MSKSKFVFLAFFLCFVFTCKAKKQIRDVEITTQAQLTFERPFVVDDLPFSPLSTFPVMLSGVALDENGFLNGTYTLYYGINTRNPTQKINVHFTAGSAHFLADFQNIQERGELTFSAYLLKDQKKYIIPSQTFVWLSLFNHPSVQYYDRTLTVDYPQKPLLLFQNKSQLWLKIHHLPVGDYQLFYQYQRKDQQIQEKDLFSFHLDIKDLLLKLPPDMGTTQVQIVLKHLHANTVSALSDYFFIPPFAVQIGNEQEECIAINDVAALKDIEKDLKAKYCLTQDIDLSTGIFTPIGSAQNPFLGELDGQGYVIKNWTFSSDLDFVGLFAVLGKTAKVKNISMANIQLKGSNRVGALAGLSQGYIEGFSLEGLNKIEGKNYLGGIAGSAETGSWTYNQVQGIQIEGEHFIGGLAGEAKDNIRLYGNLAQGFFKGQEKIGFLIGEIKNTTAIQFSYGLGSIIETHAQPRSSLLLGNTSLNFPYLREVYAYGSTRFADQTEKIAIEHWDKTGTIHQNLNTFSLKQGIVNWQDVLPKDLEIRGKKPLLQSFGSYRFFQAGQVKHPSSNQQFPSLFWTSGMQYIYQTGDDCTLKKWDLSSKKPDLQAMIDQNKLQWLPNSSAFSQLLASDAIRLFLFNPISTYTLSDFDFSDLDLIADSNDPKKYFLQIQNKALCTGIWDRIPVELELVQLKILAEQTSAQQTKHNYTLDFHSGKFVFPPVIEKNILTTQRFDFSGTELTLHFKEGTGVKPVLQTITQDQAQASLVLYTTENPLLPKQLEKIQWKNFIFPVEWSYKKKTALLERFTIEQNNQILKSIVKDGQIELQLYPLSTTLSQIHLADGAVAYHHEVNPKNKLEEGQTIDLKDQDQIVVLSEDETTTKNYTLQLKSLNSDLLIQLDRITQASNSLQYQASNRIFTIVKVNKPLLTTQPVQIAFSFYRYNGQLVSVNGAPHLVTVDGKFTLSAIIPQGENNPTLLEIQAGEDQAVYQFIFEYLSNDARLLEVKVSHNNQSLITKILQEKKEIVVYGVEKDKPLVLKEYRYTKDGSAACSACITISPNQIIQQGQQLQLEAEDGTVHIYTFVLKYKYLFLPPNIDQFLLRHLLWEDLLTFSFPEGIDHLTLKITHNNDSWTQIIDKNKTSYRFEALFKDRLKNLTKGNFILEVQAVNQEIVELKELQYDFQSIATTDDFRALAIHKTAQAILQNPLDFQNQGLLISDFIGTLDGNNHLIQNLTLQQPLNDAVQYGLFVYAEDAIGEVSLKNLHFQSFHVQLNNPKTKVAGFLMAKIPERIRMNLAHIGFSKGVISTVFDAPNSIEDMPFGILVGEVRGQTTAHHIWVWDGTLFGKKSYAGLLIGKAQNLELDTAFVVGQLNYNNDIGKPTQKYMGGLIGALTQSSVAQVYGIVTLQFSSHYAYSANRIGVLVGEADATFRDVYAVVNTHSPTLGDYIGTHFLKVNGVLQNINWQNKSWQHKFILPFGFGKNGAEIQQNGRKIVYKDNNNLCDVLPTWTRQSVYMKEPSLIAASFSVCLPVWSGFQGNLSGSNKFYIAQDVLLQ